MRRFLASILALITTLPGPIRAADSKTSELNKISVVTAEDEVVVRLVGTKSPDFTTYTQRDPFRVVVDWSGSRFVGPPEEQSLGTGLVRRIRTKQIESESEHISRVTIELALETAFRFETEGRAVLVRFKKIEVPSPEPTPSPSEPPTPAAASPSPSVAQVPDGPLTEPTELPKPPPKPAPTPPVAALPSPSPSKAAATAGAPAAAAGTQKLGAFVPEGRAKESPRPLASLSPKPSPSPAAPPPVAAPSPSPAVAAQPSPSARPSPLASLKPSPSAPAPSASPSPSPLASLKPSPSAPAPSASPSPSPLASLKPSPSAPAPSPSPSPLASLSPKPSVPAPSASPSPLASLKPSPSPAAREAAEPVRPAPAPAGKLTLAEHRPSPTEAAAPAGDDYDRGARKMTYVGFRQKSETSEVFVRVDGRARYKVEQPAPDRVVVELFDTRVNVKNNERALDTSYFNSAVTRVQAVPSAHSTRIEIDLRDNVPYEVKRIGTTISLEFKLPEG